MIDILLIDDQILLCEVLKTWLDVEEDIQVIGVGHNGQEAIEKVEQLQPDIVLMDIDMPKMDGLSAAKIISQRFPQVKVILLSGHDNDAYLGKSLRAGARGYLLKNTTADELVQKIRSVYQDVNLLQQKIDHSSGESLHIQLEELFETYRLKFENIIEEYKKHAKDIDKLGQIEQQLEQRLNEIEDQINTNQTNKISKIEHINQSSWQSIRQEIISINTQFIQANRNLSTQFERQLSNHKRDLDRKLLQALDDWSRQRTALQEWAVQRDEMRPSFAEYESKNRLELMSVVERVRTSFGNVDRQLQTMRNWLIASGLLAIFALAISGYLLLSSAESDSSATSEEKTAIE